MKRLTSSSDSLLPICPSGSGLSGEDQKGIYGIGFQSMLGGLEEDDQYCGGDEELCSSGNGSASSEKKRRLSTEQVRALEKNFEVENKLDPERKLRLAQELSLQPRQVAVWFQNRRARWKTKQLERDYSALKASYDALRLDFDALHHDKQSLLSEIKVLKTKLAGEERESFSSVKKEEEEEIKATSAISASEEEEEEEPPALIYKDVGSSTDSDSSAVLNDDCSPYPMVSSSNTSVISNAPFGFNNNCSNNSSHSSTPFNSSFAGLESSRAHKVAGGLGFSSSFHQSTVKAEDNGFLAGDEPCSSIFSDEQPPSLSWYCSDQYNWLDGGGDHNMERREGSF